MYYYSKKSFNAMALIEFALGFVFLVLFIALFTSFQSGAYQELVKLEELSPMYWDREYPDGIFNEVIFASLFFSASLGCFTRGFGRIETLKWGSAVVPFLFIVIWSVVTSGISWIMFWNLMPWMFFSNVFCCLATFIGSLIIAEHAREEELPVAANVAAIIVTLLLPLIAFLQNWLFLAVILYFVMLLCGREPVSLIVIILIEH